MTLLLCMCVCLCDDVERVGAPAVAHQCKWQQDMLLKYGRTICLIDATYNTTVYDMPLFMPCILSNCGYVVVATFLLPDEQKKTTESGLLLIRKWCPNWQPKFVMSDFSETQTSAMAVFPGKLELAVHGFVGATSCVETYSVL